MYGFYTKRNASVGYWTNKRYITIFISKAALINFSSTYWNAKGFGRWLTVWFISQQIDKLDQLIFCTSFEKETKFVFVWVLKSRILCNKVLNSSVEYTFEFSTSYIHFLDPGQLLMITEHLKYKWCDVWPPYPNWTNTLFSYSTIYA